MQVTPRRAAQERLGGSRMRERERETRPTAKRRFLPPAKKPPPDKVGSPWKRTYLTWPRVNNRCAKALAICTSPLANCARFKDSRERSRRLFFNPPPETTPVFLLPPPMESWKQGKGSCSFYWIALAFPFSFFVSSFFFLIFVLLFLLLTSRWKNHFDLVVKFGIKKFFQRETRV